MKQLFLQLLALLNVKGNITEASLYKNGKYSNITVELEDGIYSISISKEEKTDGNT